MKLTRSAIIPLKATGRIKLKLRANHTDPRKPRKERKPERAALKRERAQRASSR